jgi:hypothetical protein
MKQAVTNFFTNDVVAKRLGDDILRQSDYSRNMDQLKKEKESTANYYNELVRWKAEQDAAYAGLQPVVQQPSGDYLTKAQLEDFRKELATANQQREQQFIAITKQMGRLASRHANQFHEELDTDALEKIVAEKNVPLDRAYDLMVADRVKQQQEADFQARIKREREEAVREFASTRQIPVDASPRESGYGRLNLTNQSQTAAEVVPHEGRLTPAGYNTLKNSFVEEWSKSNSPGGTQ